MLSGSRTFIAGFRIGSFLRFIRYFVVQGIFGAKVCFCFELCVKLPYRNSLSNEKTVTYLNVYVLFSPKR